VRIDRTKFLDRYMSMALPAVREGVLSHLYAWDIAKLDMVVGLQLTTAEKERHLSPLRDVFLEPETKTVRKLRKKGFGITLLGKSLLDLDL
jgi:hypothetical protein